MNPTRVTMAILMALLIRLAFPLVSAFFLLACAQETPLKSFKCNEPLPEFTLGPYSNPSSEELEKLCGCIWNQFPEKGWERRLSRKIVNTVGQEDPDVSFEQTRAFLRVFGKAIEECAGDEWK